MRQASRWVADPDTSVRSKRSPRGEMLPCVRSAAATGLRDLRGLEDKVVAVAGTIAGGSGATVSDVATRGQLKNAPQVDSEPADAHFLNLASAMAIARPRWGRFRYQTARRQTWGNAETLHGRCNRRGFFWGGLGGAVAVIGGGAAWIVNAQKAAAYGAAVQKTWRHRRRPKTIASCLGSAVKVCSSILDGMHRELC
jgi:hypothetical protein